MKPTNHNECLICGDSLTYSEHAREMKCLLCGRLEKSNCSCLQGHYICNQCHSKGMENIIAVCLQEESMDPVGILTRLMKLPFCHTHGPEHHVLVGAALLTACHNAGKQFNLQQALQEMLERGKSVPGGACGFWGACGAGISTGMAVSILLEATPLSRGEWKLANGMTSKALRNISSVNGPRCCKRDSFFALQAAIDFLQEHLGIKLNRQDIICFFSNRNNQCLGGECPFNILNAKKENKGK